MITGRSTLFCAKAGLPSTMAAAAAATASFENCIMSSAEFFLFAVPHLLATAAGIVKLLQFNVNYPAAVFSRSGDCAAQQH